MTRAVVPAEDKHSLKKGKKIVRQQIGSCLQKLYAEVASAPVPDHIMSLLDKLESSSGRSGSNKENAG